MDPAKEKKHDLDPNEKEDRHYDPPLETAGGTADRRQGFTLQLMSKVDQGLAN